MPLAASASMGKLRVPPESVIVPPVKVFKSATFRVPLPLLLESWTGPVAWVSTGTSTSPPEDGPSWTEEKTAVLALSVARLGSERRLPVPEACSVEVASKPPPE